MKLAVASGKGGTGKTTVAVNLFHHISVYTEKRVQLVDCDVEEPNDTLFFANLVPVKQEDAFQLIPEIDLQKCTFCRKCSDWCEFNAITIVPKLNFAEINESLCHSCGACKMACPEKAITEREKPLGEITSYRVGKEQFLTEGRLKVGSAMQTTLIKKLKTSICQNNTITIYDAPPGTSCPVVETVADSDYVVLVTEPTPFGLYDLKIIVELLEELRKPYGVIVNKAGLGNHRVYNFLNEKKIELLGEIPFNRKYAESYSSGELLKNIPQNTLEVYRSIVDKLFEKEAIS
ncbi:MAG: P-loop NTPase [Tangfeifania sp.]